MAHWLNVILTDCILRDFIINWPWPSIFYEKHVFYFSKCAKGFNGNKTPLQKKIFQNRHVQNEYSCAIEIIIADNCVCPLTFLLYLHHRGRVFWWAPSLKPLLQTCKWFINNFYFDRQFLFLCD